MFVDKAAVFIDTRPPRPDMMKRSLDERRIEGKRTRLASQIETDRRTSVKNELHVRLANKQTAVQSWRTSRLLLGQHLVFVCIGKRYSIPPPQMVTCPISRPQFCSDWLISVQIPKAG